MRQFLTIALAFFSLLASQESIAWLSCAPVKAHEKCACCVTRVSCDCHATSSQQAPKPAPLTAEGRQSLPACPCLAPTETAFAPNALLVTRAPMAGHHQIAPQGRSVPKFILHCSALC